MGKGYKHGGSGGASLNFNVKTYPSETELKADNPRENTIGVCTTTTMTSWVFSATEPKEPEVGMVWIQVGVSSIAEFNALKKNSLLVYPFGAKQYEGGKFVSKPSMIYQDAKWVEFNTYLYNAGDEFTDITGGWMSEGKAYSSGSGTAPVVTRGETRITAKHNSTQLTGIFRTSKAVDLTGVKTIKATGEFYNATGSDGNVSINVWSAIGTYYPDNRVATSGVPMNTKQEEITVDVSNLQSGSYYVGFVIYSGSTSSGSGADTCVGMDSCVLLK